MGNGTSISDGMKDAKASPDMRSYLERVSLLMEKELGLKVWFCELIGKRWSHYAGEGVMMSAGIRGEIPGAGGFGYILEKEPVDSGQWDDILAEVSRRLKSYNQ